MDRMTTVCDTVAASDMDKWWSPNRNGPNEAHLQDNDDFCERPS